VLRKFFFKRKKERKEKKKRKKEKYKLQIRNTFPAPFGPSNPRHSPDSRAMQNFTRAFFAGCLFIYFF
jgi:hypothetical protein